MQIGRTSCSNFLANTFRVLTAAAYVLMQEMRLHLAPTHHAARKSRRCVSIF
jgi:hypothetical protein